MYEYYDEEDEDDEAEANDTTEIKKNGNKIVSGESHVMGGVINYDNRK